MNNELIASLEALFLALADKTRLKLLRLMAEGEVSVGYLADELGESQPKISRHLAYLRNAGLVSTRRDGKWVYYGIEPQEADGTAMVLSATLSAMSGGSITTSRSTNAFAIDEPAVKEDLQTNSAPDELPIHLL